MPSCPPHPSLRPEKFTLHCDGVKRKNKMEKTMSGYHGSPSGYLNPVAVDKIQHPDYDAKAFENGTMRIVQYLYPIIKNSVEMMEALCKETDVQVPTDLADNHT